jgi:hypothetical protein
MGGPTAILRRLDGWQVKLHIVLSLIDAYHGYHPSHRRAPNRTVLALQRKVPGYMANYLFSVKGVSMMVSDEK